MHLLQQLKLSHRSALRHRHIEKAVFIEFANQTTAVIMPQHPTLLLRLHKESGEATLDPPAPAGGSAGRRDP